MKINSLKKIVFLSIGSNLGDREMNLKKALSKIEFESIKILSVSNIFESESWAYTDHNYLNLCLKTATNLDPYELLRVTKEIEKELGRTEKTQLDKNKKPIYTSRTVDIDILLYNNKIINSANLIIPHPKLHLRAFVLYPLNEIASEIIHPILKKSIQTIYRKCTDNTLVQLFNI